MLIGRFAKDYPDCIERGDAGMICDMFIQMLEKAVVQQQDVTIRLID